MSAPSAVLRRTISIESWVPVRYCAKKGSGWSVTDGARIRIPIIGTFFSDAAALGNRADRGRKKETTKTKYQDMDACTSLGHWDADVDGGGPSECDLGMGMGDGDGRFLSSSPAHFWNDKSSHWQICCPKERSLLGEGGSCR